jgi:dienelactone hydrolase
MRKQVEAALHVDPELFNVDDKFYGNVTVAPGVAADRVSYATAYSLRVPAIVYHEAGPTITKHPALVIVNGHGGDKSSWYSYWSGILYARAGAVVLTYDPVGEFERNRERLSHTSQHDTELSPDDMARRLSGLMITDVMQAVSYLSSRHDVDKKRIAVLGFSMGSFVSALTCALDTRIHACVLAGGGDLDGPNGYWDNSRKMCQGIPYKSVSFLGERGPALYALNAERGPTLVINGTDDSVVDITHHEQPWFEQLRAATIQRLGSSKNVFDFQFVPGGTHRPYFVTKNAALWLEEKLKFPNWSKNQIESMPETNIGAWAAANHVAGFTSSYAKQNEGLTQALGGNIPAVPRDQLQAVPEAVWESASGDYIYESWVEHARSAISSGAP